MSGENIPRGPTPLSLATWLASIIVVASLLLALGFSTGVEDVLKNWPAHISIVLLLILLELAAWIAGRKRAQAG